MAARPKFKKCECGCSKFGTTYEAEVTYIEEYNEAGALFRQTLEQCEIHKASTKTRCLHCGKPMEKE